MIIRILSIIVIGAMLLPAKLEAGAKNSLKMKGDFVITSESRRATSAKISFTQLLTLLNETNTLIYPVTKDDIKKIRWLGDVSEDGYANEEDYHGNVMIDLNSNYLKRNGFTGKVPEPLSFWIDGCNAKNGYLRGRKIHVRAFLKNSYELRKKYLHLLATNEWVYRKRNLYVGDRNEIYTNEDDYIDNVLSTSNPIKDVLDISIIYPSTKGDKKRTKWVNIFTSDVKPIIKYSIKPNNYEKLLTLVEPVVKYNIRLQFDIELNYSLKWGQYGAGKKEMRYETVDIIIDPKKKYTTSGSAIFECITTSLLAPTNLSKKLNNYKVTAYIKSIDPIRK